jgi:hypothetical protein
VRNINGKYAGYSSTIDMFSRLRWCIVAAIFIL